MPGSHDNSLRKRAERFVLEGEYVRALEVYRAVLANDGPNPKAWYGIGYTYYKLGRFDQSEAALREAHDGGYTPAKRILDCIARHRNPRATPGAEAREHALPPFDRDTPHAGPRPSGVNALRQEHRHRREELIAFLDSLATRAMQYPGYLTDAGRDEVNRAHAMHEVAAEHLKMCRRTLRSLEEGAEEPNPRNAASAREAARRALAEAEADEEAQRKRFRRARRRLAIRVIERRDAPEELAHFIAEIEVLRRELEAIEMRLGAVDNAATKGRDPRRESGVGAPG